MILSDNISKFLWTQAIRQGTRRILVETGRTEQITHQPPTMDVIVWPPREITSFQ